ncbi:MAG TPA: bacteriohemerythrin [Rhodocyclaceae bacterium]|nr:bacteriohemerythrin [Rhodocyclaceae bacterium]
MDWIALNERRQTGHALIDEDHERVVALINQLASAITQHRSKDVCGALLDQVIQNTKAHFARENRLMAEHRYPRAEEHMAQHAHLVEEAQALKRWFDTAAVESVMSVSLLHFLESWWTEHIPTSDQALADFVTSAASNRT